MTTDLREELSALAATQTFSPDPSAWDRGRRVRRRDRVVRGAAAVAVVAVVAGAGVLAVRPESVGPAGDDLRGGAIPSRIDVPGTAEPLETDFAIGRASVAFNANYLIAIGAEDGRYHHFEVVADEVALSPDGIRLAWWSGNGPSPDRIFIAELESGEVIEFPHNGGSGAEVTTLSWYPDSTRLLWNGRGGDGAKRAAIIDVTGPSETPDISGRYGARGIPSPSFDVVALASKGEVTAAPFEQIPTRQSTRSTGISLERALPTDIYPDGAVVTPVGWLDEDHVVAIIDPPQSDVVERPRLAVFTSPEQPESEWTWREFLPRLPPEAISFAVDLIPDLDGSSSQELTHDFSAGTVSEPGWVSLVYGAAGVLAVLFGLVFIATMGRRRG